MFATQRDITGLSDTWRRETREAWTYAEVRFPLTWSSGTMVTPASVEDKAWRFYKRVPTKDRWGRDLEFRLFGDALAIRSAGSDGRFDTDSYTSRDFFYRRHTERDIVVINGAVVHGPRRRPDD